MYNKQQPINIAVQYMYNKQQPINITVLYMYNNQQPINILACVQPLPTPPSVGVTRRGEG
jgi:hypothetical protein